MRISLPLTATLLGAALLSPLTSQAAPPSRAEIQYEVVWGMVSLDAVQRWQLDGKHYTLSTELKLPLGIKNRRYTSRGQVNDRGLELATYEDQAVGADRLSAQAVVDKTAGELRYGPPDKPRTLKLEPGLQDMNALAYQLGWWGLAGAAKGAIPVTNGKGLVSYQFNPPVNESLQLNGKTYDTLHYSGNSREGQIEVWAAAELGGLPVQVVRAMDGRQLKFVAKKFSTTP